MWEFIPFFVHVGAHLHVGEPVDDVKRYYVSVLSLNALFASGFHGTVINLVLVVLKLSSRMDGSSNSMVCVLF